MTVSKSCSVPGCDEEHAARGLCDKHYRRWKKHGDPTVVKPSGRPASYCTVEGCDRQVKGFGYCDKHYQRYKKTGVPGPAENLRKGWVKGKPRKKMVTYEAVHVRLRSRSHPTTHKCVDCEEQAAHWSYNGCASGEEIIDDQDRKYCLHYEDYSPRCQNCHDKFDGKELLERRGETHHNTSLTETDVIAIRERRATGETLQSIADNYGISIQTVSNIHHRKTWSHLE